jgi:Protein of unknown function (DUF2752)
MAATAHGSTEGTAVDTVASELATTAASPQGRSTSWVWRWAPSLAAAAALGVVAVRDPNQAGSYGLCPLQALTGLECPFCGGLRGTHDLLHGNVPAALDHNLLLPLYLTILTVMVVVAVRPSWSRRFSQWRTRHARTLTILLVGVVVAFFVIRNLPWFPFLDAQA